MENIFQIKQVLSKLEKEPRKTYYEYSVGKFELSIYPYFSRTGEITDCDYVDTYITFQSHDRRIAINMERDIRFKNYRPIKYAPTGCSTGTRMPIYNLCHLIKYLYALTEG